MDRKQLKTEESLKKDLKEIFIKEIFVKEIS